MFSSANPLDEDVTATGAVRGLSGLSSHCLGVSWLHGTCVEPRGPQCHHDRGERQHWEGCAGWAEPLWFTLKAFCGSPAVMAY